MERLLCVGHINWLWYRQKRGQTGSGIGKTRATTGSGIGRNGAKTGSGIGRKRGQTGSGIGKENRTKLVLELARKKSLKQVSNGFIVVCFDFLYVVCCDFSPTSTKLFFIQSGYLAFSILLQTNCSTPKNSCFHRMWC